MEMNCNLWYVCYIFILLFYFAKFKTSGVILQKKKKNTQAIKQANMNSFIILGHSWVKKKKSGNTV